MEKETGSWPSGQETNELKGKKTWAMSPIICSGRLESFQIRKVTEILRDGCIDTTYWPNALNFNTTEPFVCKSRGHEKTEAAVPSRHCPGECQLPETLP